MLRMGGGLLRVNVGVLRVRVGVLGDALDGGRPGFLHRRGMRSRRMLRRGVMRHRGVGIELAHAERALCPVHEIG
jgi:hypothetical protein